MVGMGWLFYIPLPRRALGVEVDELVVRTVYDVVRPVAGDDSFVVEF